jgi:KDO2-lipid IV(A) lauroyltransferase
VSEVRLPDRAEHLLLLVVSAVVRRLPERMALALGAGCGWLAGSVLRIRRRVVADNLARAFPEASPSWRGRVGAACYRHLGREAVALLRLEGMHAAEVRERCAVSGIEAVRDALAAGRGVLLLTGHLGNWEVGGAGLAARAVPLDVVARRQRNPLFEARLLRMRERLGMRVIYRHEATRAVLRSLREPRAVALVADQNAAVGGIFVDFFGTPAATVRGPGLLAARTDALVATAFVRRLEGPRARYHLDIEPLSFERTGDPTEDLLALTRAYHTGLEAAIRAEPAQYFWFHRRWKTRPDDDPLRRDAPEAGPDQGEEPGRGAAVRSASETGRAAGAPTRNDAAEEQV